jgi:undecaprenyl-diphosphatase
MPDWLSIVILGIIEGITEFIPVSSTGHLLLAENWLPRQSDLFNIVIQSAAVLAVIPLFRKRFARLASGVTRAGEDRDYLMKAVFAFAITAVGGFILDKRHFKLEEKLAPVGFALLIGGILFIVIERWLRGRKGSTEISWPVSIVMGCGQLVAAVFPGASRSGTTIMSTMVIGADRAAATEFSFIVGVPTMLAAGGYKIFKAMRHGGIQEPKGMLLLGMAVSAIVSFVAVKWLLGYVRRNTFEAFGWYRIILGAFVLFLAFRRH